MRDLAGAVHHGQRKVAQRLLDHALGQRRQRGDRLVGPFPGHHPGLGRHGVRAQPGHGLGQRLVRAQVPVHQLEKFDGGLVAVLGSLPQEQHGQGGHTFAEVRSGRFAGLDLDPGDVDDIVGELEGHAHLLAVFHQHGFVGGIGLGKDGAELAGRRNQRTGLVSDHREVVLHRVLVRPRAHGFMQLPQAEPLEGAGLDTQCARAQLGHQDGGAGEDQVAGEDRHGVAPHLVGRGGTAAERRGVHDVVVVQRCQVGQFHHDGGLHHRRQGGVAQVGAQQGEQRPDALAAGLHQVARRRVSQRVRVGNGLAELLLHLGQVVGDGRAQFCIFGDGGESRRELESGGNGAGVEAWFSVGHAVSGVGPAVLCGFGHGLTLTFCCGYR
ncbi:s-adenosylmethionine decarboxylase [Arthrobacter nitrophenolicus]|uniref:S-adenosylmethionine decarboxylase n=1 Tax=Arthrobacter nitrophenolicus TaxID=683150 RepID=L8TP14_9MICC|nr:s-adenosylmethionine decarboxylase [Arthrobacter nitrophenolicus]